MKESLITHDESLSSTWLKLRKHCEDKLQKLRELNDGNHAQEKTAHMRGQIMQLKEILALDKRED